MTKASKKKSSGSKYAVLILTAVIAIIAIGCGLFYATSNSKKDVLDKKGDEPQTVSLLDESIEAQRLQNNSHSILIRRRLRALVIIYTHHSRQTVKRTSRQGKLLRRRQIRTNSSSALAHSTAVNRLHRQMQHRHTSFSLYHLQNIAAVLLIRQYRIAERQAGIQQLSHRRHIITAVINNDGYFSSELPDGPLLLLFCLLLR